MEDLYKIVSQNITGIFTVGAAIGIVYIAYRSHRRDIIKNRSTTALDNLVRGDGSIRENIKEVNRGIREGLIDQEHAHIVIMGAVKKARKNNHRY